MALHNFDLQSFRKHIPSILLGYSYEFQVSIPSDGLPETISWKILCGIWKEGVFLLCKEDDEFAGRSKLTKHYSPYPPISELETIRSYFIQPGRSISFCIICIPLVNIYHTQFQCILPKLSLKQMKFTNLYVSMKQMNADGILTYFLDETILPLKSKKKQSFTPGFIHFPSSQSISTHISSLSQHSLGPKCDSRTYTENDTYGVAYTVLEISFDVTVDEQCVFESFCGISSLKEPESPTDFIFLSTLDGSIPNSKHSGTFDISSQKLHSKCVHKHVSESELTHLEHPPTGQHFSGYSGFDTHREFCQDIPGIQPAIPMFPFASAQIHILEDVEDEGCSQTIQFRQRWIKHFIETLKHEKEQDWTLYDSYISWARERNGKYEGKEHSQGDFEAIPGRKGLRSSSISISSPRLEKDLIIGEKDSEKGMFQAFQDMSEGSRKHHVDHYRSTSTDMKLSDVRSVTNPSQISRSESFSRMSTVSRGNEKTYDHFLSSRNISNVDWLRMKRFSKSAISGNPAFATHTMLGKKAIEDVVSNKALLRSSFSHFASFEEFLTCFELMLQPLYCLRKRMGCVRYNFGFERTRCSIIGERGSYPFLLSVKCQKNMVKELVGKYLVIYGNVSAAKLLYSFKRVLQIVVNDGNIVLIPVD
ncbi:hypothetical protein ADUPG1_006529 [Aduncisulcus paluster]|uniref:Uncharacterized protein n=1 Tax=Aduncisulcus paluster TaxID=2918883 RepID=A0ABQ5KIK5_9EUKA|nr:hypothetical protein ADUPG1_006529 [Aduncisulcus paluster]